MSRKIYVRQLSATGSLLLSSPLYISIFLMRFSFGLVLFTLPLYLPKKEFSYLVVGLIAAAYPAAETACGPAIGILADRFGRNKWIWMGLSISTVSLFAFTLSTNVAYLVLVHSIQGVAAAMIVVASLTMVTDTSTRFTRGRDMGIYDFANLGGYMIGIFVAGVLARIHFLLAPFYLGSALAGVAAVYAYIMMEESNGTKDTNALSPIETICILISDRRAAAMFPIWLSVTTFIGMALTFGPRLGPSPMITSSVIAGVVMVLAFSQPFFGHLSDHYGRGRLMMLGMLSLIGFFATVIAMFRLRIDTLHLMPFFAIFGVGSFAFAPAALASLGDIAPKHGRGTTMGVYSVVISLGTIIGPLLGGYLLDRYGLASLFYTGLLILISALALAILIAGPDFVELGSLHNSRK